MYWHGNCKITFGNKCKKYTPSELKILITVCGRQHYMYVMVTMVTAALLGPSLVEGASCFNK